MTERTLRDRIAALLVHPTRDQDDMIYNLAIGDALAALDIHTSAQPAPDAVAEAVTARELFEAFSDEETEIEGSAWVDGQFNGRFLIVDGPINLEALADWINARIAKGSRT